MFEAKDFFEGIKSIDEADVDRFEHTGLIYLRKHRDHIIKVFENLGINNIGQATVVNGFNDILFLCKDHGLVLRLLIRTDRHNKFFSLAHPAQLLPIGWVDLSEQGSFLKIYAGEQLYDNYDGADDFMSSQDPSMFAERKRLDVYFNQLLAPDNFKCAEDSFARNFGYIETDQGDRLVSIDTDMVSHKQAGEEAFKACFQSYLDEGLGPAEAMMKFAALNTKNPNYQGLALRHHDLRKKFFQAWPNAHLGVLDAEPEKIQDFWRAAREKVINPKRIVRYETISYTNVNGVQVRQQLSTGACKEQLHPSWKHSTNRMRNRPSHY